MQMNKSLKSKSIYLNIAVLGIFLFLFAISLPHYFSNNYLEYIYIIENPNPIFRLMALFGIILILLSSIGLIFQQSRRAYPKLHIIVSILILVFFSYSALSQASLTILVEGMIISSIIFSSYVIYIRRSNSKGATTASELCSWVIVFILVSYLIVHGLPVNRWIGGVQPNLFAALALAALIFNTIATGRLSIACISATLPACLLVNSRGGTIALILFVLLYFGLSLFSGRIKLSKIQLLMVSVCLVAPLLFALSSSGVVWDALIEFTAVNERSRGLASGMTGRTDYWQVAIPEILSHPLWGNEDLANRVRLHSGLMSSALKYGLLPTALFLMATACLSIFGLVFGLNYKVKAASIYLIVFIFYSTIEESLFSIFNIQSIVFYSCISYISFSLSNGEKGLSEVRVAPRLSPQQRK